jgi:FtsP/CotA-like multicopper oxidase with cupredoxin domain
MKRRSLLRGGLGAAGVGWLTSRSPHAQNQDLLQYLCPPDGTSSPLQVTPSPRSRAFAADFYLMPLQQPLAKPLDPPPVPAAHQLYDQYPPRKFYAIYEQEFRWKYHPDPPYNAGSWSWGFAPGLPNGTVGTPATPGPTYHARYGEPILVPRYNNLPTVGTGAGHSNVTFALPSTTSHLHNGHTASESDGNPQDWIDSGEFWDHHFCCFPSNHRDDEKLTTLWYHDHRMDFTAANVYAGLSGFFLFFDEKDLGDERDSNPRAWRLPSGKYDIPLILHDVQFDQSGQVVFDPFNTDGILGDKYTVNRRIQPQLPVERRKYRLRIINGGPSRCYQLFLKRGNRDETFTIITGDGNFQTEPVEARSVYLSVAQRVDVIIDFSRFNNGDYVYLQNRLLQTNGKGPTERMMDPAPDESVMRFDVVGEKVDDPSRVPSFFRNLPRVDLSKVKRRRTWVFDYNGGLWTINGKIFEPNRVDARIERGSAEIWTLRNQGKNWSHPIHSHFTEYLLLEVNGVPLTPIPETYITTGLPSGSLPAATQPQPDMIETGLLDQRPVFQPAGTKEVVPVFMAGRRRDIATLNPSDELVVYMEWHDFLGKHVMHCHNVVHEDHSMMIRWDIVPPASGVRPDTSDSRSTERVLGKELGPHVEERPAAGTKQEAYR